VKGLVLTGKRYGYKVAAIIFGLHVNGHQIGKDVTRSMSDGRVPKIAFDFACILSNVVGGLCVVVRSIEYLFDLSKVSNCIRNV
jgi:hypothetical protein